jgi:predicted AAA+ superfamily ATPase
MRLHESSKKKKFYITDIIPISCPELPHYSNSLKFKERARKQVPIFGDKTGLFKIEFNDASIIYFAKWFSGGGKSTIIESMFATDDNTWGKWLTLFREEKRRRQKPKVGTFRLSKNEYGVVYEPIKKIPNSDILHEELATVQNSVDYYFQNVPSFMKYNQAGRRSILLYGEQGTGKTSMLYHLAIQHGKNNNRCVVFATDIVALAMHIQSCEKYNMSTLCFFEDAEGVFSQNNSSVKNFLSGIDAKQNKGGTCIVYTTNYPERMEETIIERPERIDELIYIGPIDGQMLVDCAKFYFGKHLPDGVDLSRVLTRSMTGAEVKLMVENTLRFCASRRVEINESSINAVLNKYASDIKKLHQFTEAAKKTYAKQANKKKTMGFGEEEQPEPWPELIPSNGNGHR